MLLTMLRSKIHRATVTDANLHYEGSISISEDLLQASGILPHEQVQVVDITNGSRLVTYAIPGGHGVICLNGAAARLVQPGDLVIIMAYSQMTPEEAAAHTPTIIRVDGENCPVQD